jgi:hypothetical protein
MCRLASFFHLPATGEVKVAVLDSHGDTEKQLNLDPKIWREGHYTPEGNIELRLTDEDRVDRTEYETAFHNRFPSFINFLNWAFKEIGDKYGGWLNLSGLTSAKDLVLPKEIGDSLYLNGLTSAKDLVLPKEIGGWLYLNGLTSAKDLVLPKEIGGWLNLSGLTSEEKNEIRKLGYRIY